MKRYVFFILSILLLSSQTASANLATMQDAFSPHQGATELIVKTIKEAKKSIHVAAYSFTSKPIGSALVEAHERGIDVEIVFDKTHEDFDEEEYLSKHGVPFRINHRYHIMHDKFMVIDGGTLELGSFNYTRAAENNNAENVLVIHAAGKIANDYDAQWKKLWSEGEKP